MLFTRFACRSASPAAAVLALTLSLAPAAVAASGPVLVKDLLAGSTGSAPKHLVNRAGHLLFGTTIGPSSVWNSNGTAGGTVNIASGVNVEGDMTVSGKVAYFWATQAGTGTELWRSDGSAAGTHIVADIAPGSANGMPLMPRGESAPVVSIGTGRVLFLAKDGTNGIQLYRTDGTAGGTVMVKDVNPGHSNTTNVPEFLTAIGNAAYFFAYDAVHGTELWRTDGTDVGTAMVKDINPGAGGSLPSTFKVGSMSNWGGKLLFSANDGSHGGELWLSDGTPGGTGMVADINPGSVGSFPQSLTKVGKYSYFSAADAVHGTELWRTNATGAGTTMVKDIYTPSGASSQPTNLTAVGSKLFFTAYYSASLDYEPFVTTGTTASTQLLRDINPGTTPSNPTNLTSVAGRLLFQANDGATGYELWQSDGTPAGTKLVKDLFPGGYPSNGNPNSFAAINGAAYFQADDGVVGPELWKYTPDQPILVHDHFTISDSDGDGVAQPGETIALTEHLRNSGTAGAPNASGTLATTTPGVTITAAASSWPAIGVGAVVPSNSAFTITLDSSVPCGGTIPLTLTAKTYEVKRALPIALPVACS